MPYNAKIKLSCIFINKLKCTKIRKPPRYGALKNASKEPMALDIWSGKRRLLGHTGDGTPLIPVYSPCHNKPGGVELGNVARGMDVYFLGVQPGGGDFGIARSPSALGVDSGIPMGKILYFVFFVFCQKLSFW
jgi:hypothetical protein